MFGYCTVCVLAVQGEFFGFLNCFLANVVAIAGLNGISNIAVCRAR
jgi:hypothetical protein